MGEGHGKAEGSRGHIRHRVESSGHCTGGKGEGGETMESAGKGKGLCGSGAHRGQRQ